MGRRETGRVSLFLKKGSHLGLTCYWGTRERSSLECYITREEFMMVGLLGGHSSSTYPCPIVISPTGPHTDVCPIQQVL